MHLFDAFYTENLPKAAVLGLGLAGKLSKRIEGRLKWNPGRDDSVFLVKAKDAECFFIIYDRISLLGGI